MKTNLWIVVASTCFGAFAGIVYLGSSSADRVPEIAPARGSVNPIVIDEPIQPIPTNLVFDKGVVELGRRLFHDPGLSSDGTISCASCHDLDQAGQDGRKVSIGVGGAEGSHNAPTVLNSGLNFRQFWDGRSESLEDQAGGPLTHPKEMGSTWPQVIAKLKADPTYVEHFGELYDEGVAESSIRNAIATFERSLMTPGSRFDRYLLGETDAITEEEERGYNLFRDIGCTACHQGMNVGGNLFQRIGIASNFFEDRGNLQTRDLGRFNVTGKESDKFSFKVPTLRNIAKTGPYFHDGSVPTLGQAIRIMAQYQLGVQIEDEDVRLIEAFLRTLEATPND